MEGANTLPDGATSTTNSKYQVISGKNTNTIIDIFTQTSKKEGRRTFFENASIDDIEALLRYLSETSTSSSQNKTDIVHSLNNFLFNFPGALYRVLLTKRIQENGIGGDLILGEVIENMAGEYNSGQTHADIQQKIAEEKTLHSTIKLQQKQSEFFTAIDNAIIACNFTLDEATKDSVSDVTGFEQKYRPVYVYLRRQGYSHADLIS